MKQIYLENAFKKGYNRLMNYISNIAHMPKKDRAVILERLRIIEFFEEFGEEATKKAFNKSRSTIFLWKQNVKNSGGYLSALKPGSKAPQSHPKRKTSNEITNFVLEYRQSHPGVDKMTIKPALDAFCLCLGIDSVSESTIGRIIEDLKEKGRLPDYYVRTTINGKTGHLKVRKLNKNKPFKQRIGNYKSKEPGDVVQVDAIEIFLDGIRRYIICALDIKTRFAFAFSYKSLSSNCARDFLQRFQTVAPFIVRHIQTDNGKEFHKYFDQYLKTQNMIHFWNYPRSPKMNSYVERFNGLIQKQYVGWHLMEILEPDEFNIGLVKYLTWYNTEKPHRSIGKIPPLMYFVNNFIDSEKSNMLWTATLSCLIITNYSII
jgi:transposase InsO family protein